jgi:hypothetical protein
MPTPRRTELEQRRKLRMDPRIIHQTAQRIIRSGLRGDHFALETQMVKVTTEPGNVFGASHQENAGI